MGNAAALLQKTFNINIGKFSLPVPFIHAVLIVGLIFLLILTLAQVRRHFVDWSFKGAVFGIFFGFLLALILEGFLIIGGRTAVTGVLGWKNAPKPILAVLDSGRNKLIQVLGVQAEIPSSLAKESSTVQAAIDTLQSLGPTDIKKVKALFCQP